jgi:hypothetical protein
MSSMMPCTIPLAWIAEVPGWQRQLRDALYFDKSIAPVLAVVVN